MTIHIKPTAPLAPRALLPGDPGRALQLAQLLLEEPRMFNHNRGLWGYTGTAADGQAMTIQSTGMGGPSAAIVLNELIDLGLRRAVRVGTCGALDGTLAIGDVVVCDRALSDDGASRALGTGESITPDPELTTTLLRGASAVTAVSTDLFYDPPSGDRVAAWRTRGAHVVEMECATLLTLGALRGIACACALVVTDVLDPEARTRIDDSELEAAGERVGRLGASAL